MTREHVWPRWLSALISDPEDHFFSTRDTEEGKWEWRGGRIDVTVKRVCGTCNSGWMSSLEATARPLLTRMIGGDVLVLDETQQRLVATWAVKTALMFDLMSRERLFPDEYFEAFFKAQVPVPGTVVRLGGYYEDRWSTRFQRDVLSRKGDDIVLTTMQFHAMVLQTVLDVPMDPSFVNLKTIPAGVIVRIWPVLGKRRFPPLVVMNTQDIEDLSVFPDELPTIRNDAQT